MKTRLILILLLLACHAYETKVEVIADLLQDLIRSENVPSVLSAFTCWSKSENFDFVKSSNVSIKLSNQFKAKPHIASISANKMWHFIDMRCVQSYEFLYEIDEAYFGHPYRWILFEPIEERLANLTLLTDSNVILVNFNTELSRFDLKQSKFIYFGESILLHF